MAAPTIDTHDFPALAAAKAVGVLVSGYRTSSPSSGPRPIASC